MQNDSWLWRNLTEDEQKKMIESHDRQTAQAKHNKPRTGFMFNCYSSALGRFFQENIKDKIIERGINSAHDGMLRYRCGGIARLYKYARKHPEEHDDIFQYDDRFLSTINTAIKSTVYDIVSDNDATRKRDIIRKATDVMFTMILEDRFYYTRFKLIMSKVYEAIKEDESILDLDDVDLDNVIRFNYNKTKWNKISSLAYKFIQTYDKYKHKLIEKDEVLTELDEFEIEIQKMRDELND